MATTNNQQRLPLFAKVFVTPGAIALAAYVAFIILSQIVAQAMRD